MALAETAIENILAAVESHAAASGYFDRVNRHEPANAPGLGLTAAIWVDRIAPVPAGSGLASTTVRLALMVRIYTSAIQEPQDAIDPMVLAATAALMSAYSGDFELGANVRNVDLLGQAGEPMSGQAGYLNHDGQLQRVMTITLPVLVNDAFTQSP